MVQVLVALAQNFISIEAKSTVVESLPVELAVTVTDMLNFGTMFSHSSTMTAMATIHHLSIQTLIQVWDLKDLLALCKVLIICSLLIQFRIL